VTKNYSSSKKKHRKFAPSNKPPFIPEDIYSIKYEPEWKTMAVQRLDDKGLKFFKIEVTISNGIGINSEIDALIKGVKFAANGKYDGYRKSSFSLSGTFD
jgi:hypothetical protein